MILLPLLLFPLLSSQAAFAQVKPFPGFQCSGGAASDRCDVLFYFEKCRSRFELHWPRLFLQGKKEWDAARGNWCTVKWFADGKLAVHTKYHGARCGRVLAVFADALRLHPEKPWEEGVCSLTDPSAGLIVGKQFPALQNAKSVILPYAGLCSLKAASGGKNKKALSLTCPYPDDRVRFWLKEFAEATEATIHFLNPER